MTTYKLTKALTLAVLLSAALAVQAQTFSNDFENGYSWYPPWTNIVITTDSITVDSLANDSLPIARPHYCLCDSTAEFGLGFELPVADTLLGKNLHLLYQADFRYPDTLGHGEMVFSVLKNDKTMVWQSYPIAEQADDSLWFRCNFNIDLPADHLPGSKIIAYLWNPKKERIFIDNASLTLTSWQLPSFLPSMAIPHEPPSTNDLFITSPDDSLTPLTYPIGIVNEYIDEGDTITTYQRFTRYESPKGKLYMAVTDIDTSFVHPVYRNNILFFFTSSSFHKTCKILRHAIVVPFIDSTLTLYRRNMGVENGALRTENGGVTQDEYYLDREGFKVGEGDRCIISYHQTQISSTQFDAVNRVAYLNLDYWRDHPMIHYPLSDTLEDYFEDCSSQTVHDKYRWEHLIHLDIGKDVQHLPRIMPIPYGYRAGIIFTEHADWTDIRTHRAVLFGNEHITKAKNATGGFVYFGIPVTKSVFYNNPDHVTNNEVSNGTFPGLHATIKTDREFEKLLKQLHRIGFDICLHTPEQYTTTPSNLKEALDYMKRNFKSTTWIDHGYNNGPEKNREDMVCDGLDRNADAYAAYQWKIHGIKYLWNAYYEENRMKQWYFDNNLMQPYPGFGDALPNRQVTLLEPNNSQLSTLNAQRYTWCTPSTLDPHNDLDWDYYFSEERLQRLVDHHSVYINHTYPAWVKPGRTFWTYDEDSTIVARPGMNRALARIADFRERHDILPMTVKTYLDYYTSLLNVVYEILDSQHIRLTHVGKTIEGFTLVCPVPIRFEDNRYYEFRKSGGLYYVWFDLKPHDKVIIEVIDN